jgi:hypothetical protein
MADRFDTCDLSRGGALGYRAFGQALTLQFNDSMQALSQYDAS